MQAACRQFVRFLVVMNELSFVRATFVYCFYIFLPHTCALSIVQYDKLLIKPSCCWCACCVPEECKALGTCWWVHAGGPEAISREDTRVPRNNGPADEPATLNCVQNNLRPVNAVRGMDNTGVQLLRIEARRIY